MLYGGRQNACIINANISAHVHLKQAAMGGAAACMRHHEVNVLLLVQGINSLWSGWHTAMYVADFSSVYKRLETAGLIYNDHPFRDKCYNLEDALRNKQLRFKDLIDPAGLSAGAGSGTEGNGKQQQQEQQLLYRFEQEIRSLYHPRFMRPLYNRRGPNFDVV